MKRGAELSHTDTQADTTSSTDVTFSGRVPLKVYEEHHT